MGRNIIKKNIKVDDVEFGLEIYLRLETSGYSNRQGTCYEIFPKDYDAALYAFSNKDKLNKLIEDEYIFEPRTK
tara:strand:- start:294 stop:515 length:222 start_codon:yes stop_codon:yes gene_type:complete